MRRSRKSRSRTRYSISSDFREKQRDRSNIYILRTVPTIRDSNTLKLGEFVHLGTNIKRSGEVSMVIFLDIL